jgi:hypothetical protein
VKKSKRAGFNPAKRCDVPRIRTSMESLLFSIISFLILKVVGRKKRLVSYTDKKIRIGKRKRKINFFIQVSLGG